MTQEQEYIIYKTASRLSEIKGISILEAMRLPFDEFFNASITI